MTKTNKEHKHKFNVISVTNYFNADNYERIEVRLECACDDDEPELVVIFCDNQLMSAQQNYHGWLSAVAPALVAQDFRINDKRIDLQKGEMSDD